MKRVIIYARVSTKDQKVDLQLIDLQEFEKARKLDVIKEFIDYASSAKSEQVNYKKIFR